MLRELRMAGFGVFTECVLTPAEGLNVITGETGSGKSTVVRALGMLAGARPDPGLVQDGVEEAEVEGRFEVTAPVRAVLRTTGMPVDDEVVISRRFRRGGSRGYVNGRIAAAPVLTEVGGALVELIGQHSARSLVQPSVQRQALDRFGADPIMKAAAAVADAYDRLRAVESERAASGLDPATRARELDMLRFQLAELVAAGVEEDEDERLAVEVRRLGNAEALREEVGAARAIAEEARDLLARCGDILARHDDPLLAAAAAAVGAAALGAEDAGAGLREFVDSCESDPARLEEANRRVAALKDLKRKYGPTLGDVLRYRDEAESRLATLADAEVRGAELDAEATAAASDLAAAAHRLSLARHDAAPALAASVRDRLEELALGDAVFDVQVARSDQHGRHGADDVSFVFGANPSLPARPLREVASGGEMSRVMLAIATELADRDSPAVLVFDEIDAGTGGETAVAVGHCLRKLSVARQLVCVTHLAQVAAVADCHVALRSRGPGVADAEEVRGDDRVTELSRMLSGRPDSAKARRHAEEMLSEGASQGRRIDA